MDRLNIEQVELRVSQILNPSLKAALQQVGYRVPDGYRLCVSLTDSNGRKKRSNAAAENWSPDSGRLQFWLEPAAQTPELKNPVVSAPAKLEADAHTQTAGSHPATVEVIRALDRAEHTPGWNFVSLKKFRDEVLPSENLTSVRTDVERQDVLRHAIESRLILTSKVQNPRSPQFPVTAIRLNRLMPEVKKILGQQVDDLDFHPVEIGGEPMSDTIIRERRQE